MNVESFSQLPFIRPAPAKEKPGIRLFGKEFCTGATADESFSGDTTTTAEPKETDHGGGDSTRKFECHYCCRNFPTSQALGGHQNAHKRERQHAKRAHLHSTAAAAMFHGGYRLGSSVPVPPPIMTSYHHQYSWNASSINSSSSSSIYDTTPRFYGSSYGSSPSYSHYHHHHQQQQPINGSPMGSLWRNIPAVQSSGAFNRDRSLVQRPLPLFSNDEMPSQRIISSSSSQSVQDNVSLDLHL
ncbi:hypothetical protein Vadar_024968 [Vaccinium darrowii]|uniref:Uncharacterized protein n=1 Tax=Vaccinium darrowii TaxID=229202 RepID=A0ACB7YPI2_9ERIC|nr:hypothetical protein Vadar_024968 [Vaccinium darrowii]